MSSNVQSIVCCLGDPVAGNPTQFLMQRLAASQSLDWMFVTAEVPEEKIIEAFQGIRALRFSGVAFLPPHQTAGRMLVDSVTEAALRSGHVRVARRDGNLWLGDDTLGAGIVELLKSHPDQPDASSDAESNKRVILVTGRDWLSHLVRLAIPVTWNTLLYELGQVPAAIEESTSEKTEVVRDSNPENESKITLEDSTAIKFLSFDDLSQLEFPIDAVVVDSTAACPSPKLLTKLGWAASPTFIFVEPNLRWENSLSALNFPNSRTFRSMDIAGAKAVVNFNFWTGQHAELGLVRESLDEYTQW